jgi:hypothetical protein
MDGSQEAEASAPTYRLQTDSRKTVDVSRFPSI